MNKYLVVVVTALLLPCVVQATTPIISNVSGTVSTGQALTVTGSNMVDQVTTNWKMGTSPTADWDFEGSTVANSGYFFPANDNEGNCAGPGYAGITLDTNVKLMGSKSIRMHQIGAFSGAGHGGCYFVHYPDDLGNDYYFSSYVRYDASTGNYQYPDNFMKLFLTAAAPDQIYLQPNVRVEEGTPMGGFWMYDQGGVNEVVSLPDGAMQNGRWYHLEGRFKSSSPKLFQAWVDGVLIGSFTATASSSSPIALSVGLVNFSATNSNFDLKLNMDGYVTSTSRIYPASKIEIADSATYATATKKYQEPLYLSDGSVQIKADLTGLGAGPYFLFVTNNRQEVSSAYALDGSGTPDPVNGTRISSGASMPIGVGSTAITTIQ